MNNDDFLEVVHALSSALIDDFRGFLINGVERIEVPDDKLHVLVAYEEMSKVPGWVYESGVGQNPIIEYMNLKRCIYITKISNGKSDSGFQRTVGFLTDSYGGVVCYRGKQMLQHEVLRTIALGMGYDVDEYTLLARTDETVKTPVSIVTYNGEMNVHKNIRNVVKSNRNLSLGDEPVFMSDKLIGFKSNGKFVSASNYGRYSNISSGSKKK